MQETNGARHHIAESTVCELQCPLIMCYAYLKRFLRYENCATMESSTVIDSLMEPGDLMAVLLP